MNYTNKFVAVFEKINVISEDAAKIIYCEQNKHFNTSPFGATDEDI